MDKHHKKYWVHWPDRILLALEGCLLGVAAAIVICCFRLCMDTASPRILNWLSVWKERWWTALVWMMVLIAAARFLGWLVNRVPLISGSGIPQTELVVLGKLHLSRHEWLKILPAKFVGCLVSTLGGLSLGREGPCIQMGAATAALVSGIWERFTFSGHIHIAAGAAAGMAAAFGSPIAGVFFVFEEMKTRFTKGGLLVVAFAVTTAALVTKHIFGFGLIFPFEHFQPLPLYQSWLYPLMGIMMGTAGVLYNKALLGTKNFEALHTPLPQSWRILPPMLAAFVLAFTFPMVLGGGEHLVKELNELVGSPAALLKFLLLLGLIKISFALFSYTGNVPGGILMPMLCIGAVLGALSGQLFLALGLIPAGYWQTFIVYGMVGFFVSMVRVPLTGTALVLEMSGSLFCLPGAAIVALTAFLTANALKCPPVYDSLRAAIVISRRKK